MYHFLQPDHQSTIQGILFNIQYRVSSVKNDCKILDEKNEKLQHENNVLKEKICDFVNQLEMKNPKR